MKDLEFKNNYELNIPNKIYMYLTVSPPAISPALAFILHHQLLFVPARFTNSDWREQKLNYYRRAIKAILEKRTL
jgi:hypothetical protein